MSGPRPRTRRWLGRAALVLASLLIVFALAEVATRLSFRKSRDASLKTKAETTAKAPLDPDLPVLTGTLALARRNVRGVHKKVLFRTNDLGLRGPDRSPEPAPGTLRMIITGDSVVMGEGVEEASVYSALLEQSINAGPDERRVEVVNAGLSGANIDRAMDRLELANGAYRADLLIYGFTINDIEGDGYQEVPREGAAARGAVRQNPFASSRSALLRMLFWKWLSWRHGGTKPADTWYARELRQNYFDNPDAWQHVLAGLDRFAALAAREGVCAQVFIHTHLTDLGPEHPYRGIYDRVEAAAAKRGLPVRSAYAAHAGLHAPRLWVGFFDPHPNPAGHQVLARDLEQALTLLPERCWRGRAAAPTRSQ